MVLFPNGKINIGLNITARRSDDFHELQTIFYPVQLFDVLEIIRTPEVFQVAYSQSGMVIPGNANDNLCLRAWRMLKQDFENLPPVKMHLHKNIPIGAGLGGGSSDASFMLTLLNNNLALGLDNTALESYASRLGSDCPFFIQNKPAYATGRGEILEHIDLRLSHHKILLVNPGIHISTSWAFSNVTVQPARASLKTLIQLPIESWKKHIFNDFEIPVFKAYPVILAIKQKLLEEGALYAAMSGSGSTIFGIFTEQLPNDLQFPEHYFYKWV